MASATLNNLVTTQKDFLSFKLSDSFIDKYKDKEAPFGWKDAGGNRLGEIVFIDKYSRKLEDGTKERWHQVCRRVVEGMYSIQKDWAKEHVLPWNNNKAQRSAEEAYDLLFDMKWTPPGRGLATMGTWLVNGRHDSTSLQNCFRGDVRAITTEGLIPLSELVNTTPTLLSQNGEWIKSEVKSFGTQSLIKLVVQRNNKQKTIYTTANHRWFAKDKRKADGSFKEIFTKDLNSTHRLQEVFGSGIKGVALSPIGIAAGFTYGDGRESIGYRNSNSVTLFGDKDKALIPYFEGHPSRKDRDGIEFSSLPNFFKNLPSLHENKSYLAGWLAGYFAADGSVDKDTATTTLCSYNRKNLEFVQNICVTLGVGTYDITNTQITSNFDNITRTIYKLTFIRDTLSDEFFLIEEHKSRSINHGPSRNIPHWNVVSVETTNIEEEVFCAIVPKKKSFTIEGNILTGNCASISSFDMTKTDPSLPFCFIMNVSMLGVGVGYDTRGVEKNFVINKPSDYIDNRVLYIIPDSREGWVESLRLILESYLISGKHQVDFDYSEIRPEGAPIKTFGGIAPGPEPLKLLHTRIDNLFFGREGELLTTVDIVDIANMVGACVVSGNVRRSALLAYGNIDDKNFLDLKNPDVFPERNSYADPNNPGWAYMSNNSVRVSVGTDFSPIIKGITLNGEPGVIWEDITKAYGRLADPPDNKDARFACFNPCSEQPLESGEMCTLSDIHLSRIKNLKEFHRVLKFAYLYAKTVTLLPTLLPKTNAIMQRNRRIGISLSGIADFADLYGRTSLRQWFDTGYKTVREYDSTYSEWLCVRESIKVSTVKPAGSTGLVVGESPGAHWGLGGMYFNRAMILSKLNPIVQLAQKANYKIETCVTDPNSFVVYFPIKTDSIRSDMDVSIYEKVAMAVEAQKWWSDNGVSVTVSFDPETEANDVARVLEMYDGQLKAISFLPKGNTVYPQQPFTSISSFEYDEATETLDKIDLNILYDGDIGLEAEGESGCTTDTCEVKWMKTN